MQLLVVERNLNFNGSLLCGAMTVLRGCECGRFAAFALGLSWMIFDKIVLTIFLWTTTKNSLGLIPAINCAVVLWANFQNDLFEEIFR